MHHYIDSTDFDLLKEAKAHLSIQTECEYEGKIYKSPETAVSIDQKMDLALINRTIDDIAHVIATESIAMIDALKMISTEHRLTLFFKDDAGELLKAPTIHPLLLSASFGR